jgi:hypothetical protein
MQDPASELPRIPIPRTPVNKGKKKGHRHLEHDPSSPLHLRRHGWLLSLELRQTIPEALRDGLVEFVNSIPAHENLLAVGGDRVFT